MTKTLVIAVHEEGPAHNGHDGCHARAGNDGMCPGVGQARFLNSLGEDDDYFITPTALFPHGTTNGTVRRNYWNNPALSHVVAVNPALAEAEAYERRMVSELRTIRLKIKKLKEAMR